MHPRAEADQVAVLLRNHHRLPGADAVEQELAEETLVALGAVLLGFERVGDRERIEARNVVGVGEADPHDTQSRM